MLISMAASSGEHIPRGIEFLFSPNRLNVAISRARCLSIVLASPLLLGVTCRTVRADAARECDVLDRAPRVSAETPQ